MFTAGLNCPNLKGHGKYLPFLDRSCAANQNNVISLLPPRLAFALKLHKALGFKKTRIAKVLQDQEFCKECMYQDWFWLVPKGKLPILICRGGGGEVKESKGLESEIFLL